jgi:hypothetical protein
MNEYMGEKTESVILKRGESMTMRLPALATILLAAIAVTGFTQDASDDRSFVSELSETLREQDWTEAEVDELVGAAEALDWPNTTGVGVEVVSLALSFYRNREADAFSPGEAALLASELANVAAAMQESGFRPVEIGRATVEGTRDALAGAMGRPDAPAPAGVTGEALRKEVLSRVRDQIRVVASGRGPDIARRMMRQIDDLVGGPGSPDGIPQGPAGAPFD